MKHDNRNAICIVSLNPEPTLDLDELISRAIEGDREALDAVVRELHPRLHLLRMTTVFARKHARDVRRFRVLE